MQLKTHWCLWIVETQVAEVIVRPVREFRLHADTTADSQEKGEPGSQCGQLDSLGRRRSAKSWQRTPVAIIQRFGWIVFQFEGASNNKGVFSWNQTLDQFGQRFKGHRWVVFPWQLPGGVRTNWVITEVPPFPVINDHGNMLQYVATGVKVWQDAWYLWGQLTRIN